MTYKLTTLELQKHKATVIPDLKALVLSREELTDGFAYEFNGHDEVLDALNTFLKTELLRCEFFAFQLTVRDDKALLHITGRRERRNISKKKWTCSEST